MLLPLIFLRFWFLEAPIGLIGFFGSLNKAFLQLFSLPLLVRTYFKPWKNEYREGLVGFSIGMGMGIKTFVIIADIVLLLILLIFEFLLILGFTIWPIAIILLLFYDSSFFQIALFSISVLAILIMFFRFKSKKKFADIVESKQSTKDIIKFLLSKKEIQFILQKASIREEEIVLIDIPKETFPDTTFDFFASYLLAIEEKTKLLFKKQLKKEDILNISYWAKVTFPEVLNKKPFRVEFSGEGAFESWTYGWTLETKKYMVDLTPEILNKKTLLVGRRKEYEELLKTLAQGKSILLVGEPGSGKNSLVEAFVSESFSQKLEGNLYHQRVFKLYLDTLLAGGGERGELEKRLDNIIQEIAHSGQVIIYIPDFENILGSASFHLDLSGVLIPYLKNKTIRIIASATTGSYKKFIEPISILFDVFEVVKMQDMETDMFIRMLFSKTAYVEKEMKVSISYKAVMASLNLANRYLIDRVMPGAAVILLEDTANEIRLASKKEVKEEDVLKRVEEKTNVKIGPPGREEKDLLLNLEERMHESLIDQEEAVSSIAEGIRRIRTGLHVFVRPISFLFLGPTGVGKTETAKTLSRLYFKDEKNMIRFDMSEYSGEDSIARFIGEAIGATNEGISGKVHENPSSLILLDEFEKAHPNIHNLFLEVLDDGRLTDINGKTVSFANAIIVATSNAGSEFIREEIKEGRAIDKRFKDQFLGYLLSENIFSPELLNRFDDIIVFRSLGKEEIYKITKLMLAELSKRLLEKDITVNFDEKIIAKIGQEGSDEQFGARPLRRFIQDNIEDAIAQKMLREEIKRGDKINVSVDDTNNLQLTVNN
ncbi:MAG: ATP-dependent Clp protease ATP-binding subunit [Patescibacteria group bacterium]